MDKVMDEWLTSKEAAAYLKVTRRTIYRLMHDGQLPYHTMPKGRRRIRREDLDAIMRPSAEEPKP
jgi:excisionase family DNA binding protein